MENKDSNDGSEIKDAPIDANNSAFPLKMSKQCLVNQFKEALIGSHEEEIGYHDSNTGTWRPLNCGLEKKLSADDDAYEL